MQEINLLTIFLTGLFAGGLTCMAVQGGLLASTVVQKKEDKLTVPSLASFLTAKLIVYTLLGFFLGWVGSLFQLSIPVQFLLQLFVAIFMVGTALNILNVHPIFRYFIIQPPKFLTRLVRKQSKSKELFAPALLGAFTVFIPCGTTQAMMALAVASGSSVQGAAILFSFVLGTIPLFFSLGYFTSKLSESNHNRSMRVAAFAIIVLALFNLNNALSLMGLGISFSTQSIGSKTQPAVAVTEATINIAAGGYYPSVVTLKAGTPVTLNLVNTDSYSCASAFTIPSLGIQKYVQTGKTEKIQFTTPSQPTEIAFMCSMGMFRGIIKVI